ncbi:hypothetical protein [Spirosoma rhododendri]|uniref:Uncharacterized protein n=1 Tax=Spirosoma rhododendri TaxID=2728024 RepID=A0A7L5DJJ5_9BACT|nr:hypothetical protein [Spirosoma rhododendri]QJD78609.1 hypothetical protein HH216_09350 [Spirosoma rhododendri]
METNTNPFKDLEPDVHCPPELKREIFAELDMVRNALQVVEVYAYDIFTVLTVFLDGLMPVDNDNDNTKPRS